MLKVALTGGIATGKSYVLEQFRRRGVPCLDADVLAHGVTTAGTEASSTATGFPPGSRVTPGGTGSRCSRIIARNRNTNGMKYVMIDMLTSRSYAPCTLLPVWLSSAQSIPARP